MGERQQRGRERATGNNIHVLCKKKRKTDIDFLSLFIQQWTEWNRCVLPMSAAQSADTCVYKCNKCSESKKSLEKRNIQGKYRYLKDLLKKHTKCLYFVCFPPLAVTNNLFSPSSPPGHSQPLIRRHWNFRRTTECSGGSIGKEEEEKEKMWLKERTRLDIDPPQFAEISLCCCCFFMLSGEDHAQCCWLCVVPQEIQMRLQHSGTFALIGCSWVPHRPRRAHLSHRHALSLLDRWRWTDRLTVPLPRNSSTCSSPHWAMWVTTAPAFDPVLPGLPGLPGLLTACRPYLRRWSPTAPTVCRRPSWLHCWCPSLSTWWARRRRRRSTSCGSSWETPGTSPGWSRSYLPFHTHQVVSSRALMSTQFTFSYFLIHNVYYSGADNMQITGKPFTYRYKHQN